MLRRNPARYLAPIALLAVIAATYLIVHKHVGDSKSTTTSTSIIAPTTTGHHASHHKAAPKYYTIQQNDNLSTISTKTGVPVPTLEALNPGINPNALQTGQRLRLRQ